MNNRDLILWSAAAIAAMLVAGLVVGLQLPAGARLPIHWGVDGRPDGFAGKWTALFLPALFAVIITGTLATVSRVEPKQESLAQSAGLYRTVWGGMIALFWAIEVIVISAALDWKLAAARVLLGAIGIFFVGVGDQLGKSRRMYMIGIRTPWTLADEDVWIATHRLGGKLMVGAGAACFLLAALGVPVALAFVIGVGLILVAAVVPAFYSYRLWRKSGSRYGG